METIAPAPQPRETSARRRPAGQPAGAEFRTPRGRLFADRFARWSVTAGGAAIIAGILGILVFISIEVSPLMRPSKVTPGSPSSPPAPWIAAMVTDEHRTHVAALSLDGRARVLRKADGKLVVEKVVAPESGSGNPLVSATALPGRSVLAASTTDGRVLIVPVSWPVGFDEQQRVVTPEIGEPIILDVDPSRTPPGVFAASLDDSGTAAAAAQIGDGSIVFVRREIQRNAITGESTSNLTRSIIPARRDLTALGLDREQRNLYGGTSRGDVLWWPIRDGRLREPEEERAGTSAVTALTLLIGDRSLVAGQADGTLSLWFQVRQPNESFRLRRVRAFGGLEGSVKVIAPSFRGKGFLAADDRGALGLFYSTSGRTLWIGASPVGPVAAAAYAPKADGAEVAGADGLAPLDILSPHPEVGFRALFGKVWYEGYPSPEYAWQSTGGSDDFEPKLSLVPLMVGTLKGTLYSLILAIPLGVLGAMYTSQFMHPVLKRWVKPAVEIMAALPSVVLGFLAGLWLAPRLEKVFPSLLLMAIVLPVSVLLAGILWRALPRSLSGRLPAGSEIALLLVALAVGIWISIEGSRPAEALLFGGSFPQWLLEVTGLRYDQRNAVVVGIAMGFAVIPIIFAISEDAFSNVPANLASGSLALGATRWQTVTRLVLPTASPGIFSAIMVGFGRAIGETMIVVMATGNTPILDWSPFDGFRTLSANIAVEIPEAPQGGTLYRTLFLAALLLFAMTFVVNTAAELVRQRLRRRYAQI